MICRSRWIWSDQVMIEFNIQKVKSIWVIGKKQRVLIMTILIEVIVDIMILIETVECRISNQNVFRLGIVVNTSWSDRMINLKVIRRVLIIIFKISRNIQKIKNRLKILNRMRFIRKE